MGLWMTIESCEMALRGKDISYEYSIVMNGADKIPENMKFAIKVLRESGKLAQMALHPAPMSPPSARQLATQFCKGKYLFFFDDHCIVENNYFTRAIETMDATGAALLHSTTRFHSDAPYHFEYILRLETNFWATTLNPKPQRKHDPYRVAMGGHGGCVLRRDVWETVGGYWTGFDGYGGEETYIAFKLWMFGYEVWVDPKLIHYHFAGERPYSKHFTDDYFRNMMMCANIIGGEEWAGRVYDKFSECAKQDSGKSMFDLYMEAIDRSREHAQQIAGRRLRTLDQQLQEFITKDIPH